MLKKLILACLVLFFTITGAPAFQDNYTLPSSVYTGDQAGILSGEHFLYGIMVATDGTNDCTIVSYDNTAASGTKVHPDWVVGTSADNMMSSIDFDPPVLLKVGLSVDMTLAAGACSYVVYYRKSQ